MPGRVIKCTECKGKAADGKIECGGCDDAGYTLDSISAQEEKNEYRPCKCVTCKGKGKVEGEECGTCSGKKTILEFKNQ